MPKRSRKPARDKLILTRVLSRVANATAKFPQKLLHLR